MPTFFTFIFVIIAAAGMAGSLAGGLAFLCLMFIVIWIQNKDSKINNLLEENENLKGKVHSKNMEKISNLSKFQADKPKIKNIAIKENIPKTKIQEIIEEKTGVIKSENSKISKYKPYNNNNDIELYIASTKLAMIVGKSSMKRTEMVIKFWDYIKANELQDKQNKRLIHCDSKLKKLCNKDSITIFEVSKIIKDNTK